MCVLNWFSLVWLFATYVLQPTRLLCPWDSSGKNTGVGCHALLQGIFLTQRLNPGLLPLLLHLQEAFLPLAPPGTVNFLCHCLSIDHEVFSLLLPFLTSMGCITFLCFLYFYYVFYYFSHNLLKCILKAYILLLRERWRITIYSCSPKGNEINIL